MRNVVLVAPHATPNTLRYVEALCALPDVRPAVLSCDPLDRFPAPLRARLAAHEQVGSCLDAGPLTEGTRRIAARIGPVDRLFGVLEQVQMAVAETRDRADVPGMGAEVVRRFRDKSAMKEALRAAGVPCARHARVESPADARAFAEEVGWPLIIKPVDGLGTRSTWRLQGSDDLERALQALQPSPARPAQCEEFLTGSEHSFETVSIDGRPVWSSSTDYIPGPLEAMETPWIQYCVVLPREDAALDRFRDVNHAALDALGMQTGLSHMEWFARADGSTAVNEVGARPPGVNIMPLMSLAHGIDFVHAWVRLMALDQFDPPQRRRAAGSAFLRGQGHGPRVTAVDGLDEALRDLGPLVAEVKRPRPGQPRGSGYEGEGHVIVAADTTEQVMRALARIIRHVRVRLG